MVKAAPRGESFRMVNSDASDSCAMDSTAHFIMTRTWLKRIYQRIEKSIAGTDDAGLHLP